jgi:hypothetical protein
MVKLSLSCESTQFFISSLVINNIMIQKLKKFIRVFHKKKLIKIIKSITYYWENLLSEKNLNNIKFFKLISKKELNLTIIKFF